MRLRRPRPGYHGTRSADSNFSAFCPAPSRAFPRPPGPRRPLSPKFLVLPARPPPRPQAHMRSRASPDVVSGVHAAREGPRPSARAGKDTPLGTHARKEGHAPLHVAEGLWLPQHRVLHSLVL
uniref:Uncharacterized protein n=1 Tax=Myotis myotis TaxID=51298 RepID=A0A7J7UCX7_MYOMY|nr:hypothetical protein mMyoMyo1_008752 [Myotis myotis]